MDETPLTDEELWELIEEETDEDLPPPPRWRRPASVIVAAVTAAALAFVPVYNLFGPGRTVSHAGLEVCGFDYCVVQEAVIEAGLLPVAGRLSNEVLSDTEASALAGHIAAFLEIDPVPLTVVDRLEDGQGGVYIPSSREIVIRRPADAWTVAHEMAHVVSTGHGEDFITALIAIARWLDGPRQPGR